MRAKRTDNNHGEIIAHLRSAGALVFDTHQLENFVDIVVVYNGMTFLVEIKSDKGKLTQSQKTIEFLVADRKSKLWILRNRQDCQLMLETTRQRGEK